MPEEPPELPLLAPGEILAALVALLPSYVVNVRRGGVVSPTVPSMVTVLISDALAKGYTIDRTNGDGPLAEWDGWLTVEREDGEMIYVEMDKGKIPTSP